MQHYTVILANNVSGSRYGEYGVVYIHIFAQIIKWLLGLEIHRRQLEEQAPLQRREMDIIVLIPCP